MFSTKNITCLFLVLLIAAPSAMALDVWFVGTMNGTGDDWGDPNNWLTEDLDSDMPTATDTAVFGYGTDSYARVYSGIASSGSLELSRGDNAGVIVDAGATLNVYSRLLMGYQDPNNDDPNIYLTVNGTLNQYGGNVSLGIHGNNVLTINEGGHFNIDGWATIGQGYGGEVTQAFGDMTVYHNGGTFTSNNSSGGGVEMHNDSNHTMLYKWSGGTINTTSGGGWFNLGGTFEVAGQTEYNGSGMRFYAWDFNWTDPETNVHEIIPGDVTLKFSGTDPLMTVNSGINFGDMNDPNRVRYLIKLDVGDLTLSQSNEWVTVTNANYIMNPESLTLIDGGDANWHMRIVDANGDIVNRDANGDLLDDANGDAIWERLIQVAYGDEPQDCVPSIADIAPVASGGDGIVDGADLGVLLARWKDTGPSIADIAPVATGGDGIVDGADLGALLARWKDTTVCPEAVPAVPEPATMSLLALAGVGLLRRRSAQVLRRKKR